MLRRAMEKKIIIKNNLIDNNKKRKYINYYFNLSINYILLLS